MVQLMCKILSVATLLLFMRVVRCQEEEIPVSEHELPKENIPVRPDYRGPGHWATPAPDSGIELGFVPMKLYAQVRHTSAVKHLPQSDAFASASTPEELANAARLREVISSKKISEVYSEEGYEDSAYDHAGYDKKAEKEEGYERKEGEKKPKRRRQRKRPHREDDSESEGSDTHPQIVPAEDEDQPRLRRLLMRNEKFTMTMEDHEDGREPLSLTAQYSRTIQHPSFAGIRRIDSPNPDHHDSLLPQSSEPEVSFESLKENKKVINQPKTYQSPPPRSQQTTPLPSSEASEQEHELTLPSSPQPSPEIITQTTHTPQDIVTEVTRFPPRRSQAVTTNTPVQSTGQYLTWHVSTRQLPDNNQKISSSNSEGDDYGFITPSQVLRPLSQPSTNSEKSAQDTSITNNPYTLPTVGTETGQMFRPGLSTSEYHSSSQQQITPTQFQQTLNNSNKGTSGLNSLFKGTDIFSHMMLLQKLPAIFWRPVSSSTIHNRPSPTATSFPPITSVPRQSDLDEKSEINLTAPRQLFPEEKPQINVSASRQSVPEINPKINVSASRQSVPEENPQINVSASRQSVPEENPQINVSASRQSVPEDNPQINASTSRQSVPEENPQINFSVPRQSASMINLQEVQIINPATQISAALNQPAPHIILVPIDRSKLPILSQIDQSSLLGNALLSLKGLPQQQIFPTVATTSETLITSTTTVKSTQISELSKQPDTTTFPLVPIPSSTAQVPSAETRDELLSSGASTNLAEQFAPQGFWGPQGFWEPIEKLVEAQRPKVKFVTPAYGVLTSGKISAKYSDSGSSKLSKSQSVEDSTVGLRSEDKSEILTLESSNEQLLTVLKSDANNKTQVDKEENTTSIADETIENEPQEMTAEVSEDKQKKPGVEHNDSSGSSAKYHKQLSKEDRIKLTQNSSLAYNTDEWVPNQTKYIESLTIAQYSPSRPKTSSEVSPTTPVIPGRRRSNMRDLPWDLADAASDNVPSVEIIKKIFLSENKSEAIINESKPSVPDSSLDIRRKRSVDNSQNIGERGRKKRKYLSSTEEDLRVEDEAQRIENEKDEEVLKNSAEWSEAVRIAASGRKPVIPFNIDKFPYYMKPPSDTLSPYSPLRYALNPRDIPRKTEGGMEFYESRESVYCPEVSPQLDVVPKRKGPGVWNEKPRPKLPRLKGLGDKIDCLRVKYFGLEPLDNPFFKEKVIGNLIPASSAKADNIDLEDQLGFYADIIGHIRSLQNLGNTLPQKNPVHENSIEIQASQSNEESLNLLPSPPRPTNRKVRPQKNKPQTTRNSNAQSPRRPPRKGNRHISKYSPRPFESNSPQLSQVRQRGRRRPLQVLLVRPSMSSGTRIVIPSSPTGGPRQKYRGQFDEFRNIEGMHPPPPPSSILHDQPVAASMAYGHGTVRYIPGEVLNDNMAIEAETRNTLAQAGTAISQVVVDREGNPIGNTMTDQESQSSQMIEESRRTVLYEQTVTDPDDEGLLAIARGHDRRSGHKTTRMSTRKVYDDTDTDSTLKNQAMLAREQRRRIINRKKGEDVRGEFSKEYADSTDVASNMRYEQRKNNNGKLPTRNTEPEASARSFDSRRGEPRYVSEERSSRGNKVSSSGLKKNTSEKASTAVVETIKPTHRFSRVRDTEHLMTESPKQNEERQSTSDYDYLFLNNDYPEDTTPDVYYDYGNGYGGAEAVNTSDPRPFSDEEDLKRLEGESIALKNINNQKMVEKLKGVVRWLSPEQVNRVLGAFISRHNPSFSSRYRTESTNNTQEEEHNIATTFSSVPYTPTVPTTTPSAITTKTTDISEVSNTLSSTKPSTLRRIPIKNVRVVPELVTSTVRTPESKGNKRRRPVSRTVTSSDVKSESSNVRRPNGRGTSLTNIRQEPSNSPVTEETTKAVEVRTSKHKPSDTFSRIPAIKSRTNSRWRQRDETTTQSVKALRKVSRSQNKEGVSDESTSKPSQETVELSKLRRVNRKGRERTGNYNAVQDGSKNQSNTSSTTVAPKRLKAVEHRRVTKEEIFTRTFIPDDDFIEDMEQEDDEEAEEEPNKRETEYDTDIYEPYESLQYNPRYVAYEGNRLGYQRQEPTESDYRETYKGDMYEKREDYYTSTEASTSSPTDNTASFIERKENSNPQIQDTYRNSMRGVTKSGIKGFYIPRPTDISTAEERAVEDQHKPIGSNGKAITYYVDPKSGEGHWSADEFGTEGSKHTNGNKQSKLQSYGTSEWTAFTGRLNRGRSNLREGNIESKTLESVTDNSAKSESVPFEVSKYKTFRTNLQEEGNINNKERGRGTNSLNLHERKYQINEENGGGRIHNSRLEAAHEQQDKIIKESKRTHSILPSDNVKDTKLPETLLRGKQNRNEGIQQSKEIINRVKGKSQSNDTNNQMTTARIARIRRPQMYNDNYGEDGSEVTETPYYPFPLPAHRIGGQGSYKDLPERRDNKRRTSKEGNAYTPQDTRLNERFSLKDLRSERRKYVPSQRQSEAVMDGASSGNDSENTDVGNPSLVSDIPEEEKIISELETGSEITKLAPVQGRISRTRSFSEGAGKTKDRSRTSTTEVTDERDGTPNYPVKSENRRSLPDDNSSSNILGVKSGKSYRNRHRKLHSGVSGESVSSTESNQELSPKSTENVQLEQGILSLRTKSNTHDRTKNHKTTGREPHMDRKRESEERKEENILDREVYILSHILSGLPPSQRTALVKEILLSPGESKRRQYQLSEEEKLPRRSSSRAA